MVGRMPKRRVSADEIANQFSVGEGSETPEQKRTRIAQAIQNTQSLVGDIQNGGRMTRQDARDDMVMRKAHRLAKGFLNEGLSLNDLAAGIDGMPGLSMADVMLPDVQMPSGMSNQFLTEEFPTNHDNVIMEELYQPPRPPVQPTRQQRPIREQVAQQPSRETRDNWRVKRYLGETRGGNEVQVWRVENAKTGNKLPNLFRLEGVASRISLHLNESGDPNDPRVLSLVNAYEKRDKLLKEARQLEKSADGKQMKSERLRQIRAEINQLDYKLGV